MVMDLRIERRKSGHSPVFSSIIFSDLPMNRVMVRGCYGLGLGLIRVWLGLGVGVRGLG